MTTNTSTKQQEKKVNLRDLDDMSCSNIVVARQINRLIRKFKNLNDIAIDCWTCGGHYTRFTQTNEGRFKWTCCLSEPYIKGYEVIKSDDDDISKEVINKLVVTTYRTMCESHDGIDLIDTPEELLAFAETKLQEMLKDSVIV